MLDCIGRDVPSGSYSRSPCPQVLLWSPSPRLQVSRNDWGSALFLGALDMIFSAAQHSNAAIAEMVSILSWEWAWGIPGHTLSLGPCILPRVPAPPIYPLAFGSLIPSP